MVFCVCFMLWWKFLAWASWNFELVQLFLINWSADCFARHAWCSLSVLFRDGKFLLEAVGILSLCNYSSSIGLHIVFLGTHRVLPLFYFVMENSCLRELEFWACANIINHFNTSVSVHLCKIDVKNCNCFFTGIVWRECPLCFHWPESVGSLKYAFSIGSQPIPGGKRRGRFPTWNRLGAQSKRYTIQSFKSLQ